MSVCEHGFARGLCLDCCYEEGRIDGLEEAAKLVDTFPIFDPGVVSVAIRALKDKP